MTTVSTAQTASSRRRMRAAVAQELRQDNPDVNAAGRVALAGRLIRVAGYDLMRVTELDKVTRRCLVWNVLGVQAGLAVILNGH